MQVAVIEFARHVCGLEGANSSEFDENASHKVIYIIPGQEGKEGSGGTMRLGAYPCKITEGTLLERLYGAGIIHERHRHRYEFNNGYYEDLNKKGLVISGASLDGGLVEAVELPDNNFYLGVQFHPEFKSRPNKPHPLFLGLVKAAARQK